MRGEFLDVGGARLYYYAAGTRGGEEPLVLIHGFPTSSHVWQDLVPLLPEGRRVVVFDLLGYGRSDPPGDLSLAIKAHADRLLVLLDLLGINRACLIGHDIGGGIAQAVAVKAPHRVSHLCLISSVAFDEWPSREVKMARATLPLTRHLPATWLLGVLKTDLARGYVDPDLAARSIDRYRHVRSISDSKYHPVRFLAGWRHFSHHRSRGEDGDDATSLCRRLARDVSTPINQSGDVI